MLWPVKKLKTNRKKPLCSSRGICCIFKEVKKLPVNIVQKHLKSYEQLTEDEYNEL